MGTRSLAGLHVQKHKCNQCLFTKNKIVNEERKQGVIKGCLKKDHYFSCHKDMLHGYSKNRRELCCRGWFDVYGARTSSIRIAKELDVVTFVKVPEKD